MQTFFDDGDEHVSSDSDPYLRLDRILAGTQKGFDTQMLLDPFEEQFDLPALLVKRRDHLWLEREIVGQKCDALPRVVLDDDAPQRCGIAFARIKDRQHTGLIAQDVARSSVDGMRISPLELCVALGSRDKEGVHRVQLVQSAEIQIATVHQIIRAGLDNQVVENIDFVGLAICDVNEAGDRAAQIEQRVQFDCRLGGSKRRPRIHGQAKIDCRGIERVHRRVQVHAQRLAGIQRSRHCNEMLSKIGINLPRSRGVRIGQGIARYCRTSKAHVVQPMRLRPQIHLDVAQRFPIGQLRKRHSEELIQAGKILDLVLAPMGGHAAPKGSQRQIGHELRENEFALMHRSFRRIAAKSAKFAPRRSNRDQTKTSIYANESLTYELLMCKRWDTTDAR